MSYYKITNADGKVWVMPQRNMRLGMMLYQPSAWKGHLLKSFFPCLSWCKPVKKALHIDEVESPVSVELQHKLEEIFEANNLEYSYFGGTPGVHRKVTIQIYKDGRILGYCKTTDSKDIYALFRHEERILSNLAEKVVNNIPRCLYSGEWREGEYLFVQTTIKTSRSKVVHKMTSSTTDFLQQLFKKTSVECLFEDTDEYEWIVRLENNLWKLSKYEQDVVRKGIEVLKNHFGHETHTFCAYHSDYTPWNMFVEDGKLFVFDFEYAGLSYVPYLDVMHHFTQTGIFEKGWDSTIAYGEFMTEEETFSSFFQNPQLAYIAYLLDQLAKYTDRETDQLSEGTRHFVNIWIPLIELLLNKI